MPTPSHFLDTFLADFLATVPADSPLIAGASAFNEYIQKQLQDDPITSTRTDRFGLCLARRSGKSLRLTAVQVPTPSPLPVPVMGQLGLEAVGEMEVRGAQPIRGRSS